MTMKLVVAYLYCYALVLLGSAGVRLAFWLGAGLWEWGREAIRRLRDARRFNKTLREFREYHVQ